MADDILDHFGTFDDTGEIVAARFFNFESDARMYGAHLKEAGIPFFISNANTSAAMPLTSMGGVGLHVREIDLAAVAALFKEMDALLEVDKLDDSYHDADEEDIAYLQAAHAEEEAKKRNWAYIVVLIFFILLIIRTFLKVTREFWDF
ncbi:MAG TPA: hypothetical protein PKA00_23270 [Saprospiraceae bacterium]|nr:hypothetical protein [Saprospiraceae bacterium]HMQ85850.1 hypothetical protein [Saprospiraceae bacterium]